ncbi:hypothetical protein BQ8482_20173 [Mesorhizobium delmotii]|uniref:Uncharacterized protein n=1 Tax=Mesorhizobium delmotii TaxID=1631247 RepID=A0A2P9AK87_9HYPH|nr:hypothetical protein BQ8482_20173 [Mesorhizobium delmotii]
MAAAIDDGLRRIDRAAAEGAHILILPLGVLLAAQRVLPTEIIPVVDMIGERDDVLLGGKLGEEFIGRQAGTATLAGEELDDAQGLVSRGFVSLGFVGLAGKRIAGKSSAGKHREGQRQCRKPQWSSRCHSRFDSRR